MMKTSIVMQPPGHGLSDVGDLSVLKCEGLNDNTPVRRLVTSLKWVELAKISFEGRAMSC